jgi:hypothetical protein
LKKKEATKNQQLYKSGFAVWSGLRLTVGLAVGLTLLALAQTAFAYQGQVKPSVEKLKDEAGPTQTAFTYQGQLQDSGLPAIGTYDLRFTLFTGQTAGDELGSIAYEGVFLTNGLFSVKLDFGSVVSNGVESWLEIAVRPSSTTDPYTVLMPRQRLTPTPYAIHAQAESWSLIGVPVGFARPVDTETVVTDKTADVPETSAKTTGRQQVKDNDLVKKEAPAAAGSEAAVSPGRQNYIVKFNAAGAAAAESIMYDNGNVGIGTAIAQAHLHLLSPDDPTVFRIQSARPPRNLFGSGRIEFWSDPQGETNEWRPGFIQSTNNGDWTGGLAFFVNGTGFAQKTAQIEVMRIVNGRVGIGTASPAEELHIWGPTGGWPAIRLERAATGIFDFAVGNPGNLGGGNRGLQIHNSGTSAADFGIRGATSGDVQFFLKGSTGNVGIGTTGPTERLHVAGKIRVTSLAGGGPQVCADGNGVLFPCFIPPSDARLKTNIMQLTNVLDKVENIRGVSFEWNKLAESLGSSSGRREIGVIAQEVEAVFPELVTQSDNGYKTVDYDRLTAVLIEAVKELRAENQALKQRVKALEKTVETK